MITILARNVKSDVTSLMGGVRTLDIESWAARSMAVSYVMIRPFMA